MKRQLLYTILSIILLTNISVPKNAHSVSATMKSENAYKLLLNHLRVLNIIIDNFGTDEQKQKYITLQGLFQKATQEYYSQNFVSSHQKYYKLKLELISLVNELSQEYIKRTEQILDSTSKQSFDILVKFDKNATLAEYFKGPFNPIDDIKAYDEKEYHFFHDKIIIESYLRNGYKKLEDARRMLDDPTYKTVIRKKKKTDKILNFIIKKHMDIISCCRLAKLYGLEIYRIININDLGNILIKYNISVKQLLPIYDDRIPEEYKPDANDVISRLHSHEMKKISKN